MAPTVVAWYCSPCGSSSNGIAPTLTNPGGNMVPALPDLTY